MKLTTDEISRIVNVIHTLKYGARGGWVNPTASLDACISVLEEVKKSIKLAEGSTKS